MQFLFYIIVTAIIGMVLYLAVRAISVGLTARRKAKRRRKN